MANILVNGFKAKAGGGKSILNTYLTLLGDHPDGHTYFVLTPDRAEYERYGRAHVRIVEIADFYDRNLAFPLLYAIGYPRLIRRHGIDAIVNFGDVIIPSSVPQLYYFDWPHAVYPESEAWKRFGRSEMAYSKIKLFMFKRFLKHATVITAQTEVMVQRLQRIYGLNNVSLVPNAVSLDNVTKGESHDFGLDGAVTNFLYLTHYYTHKNIEVLLPVARLIRDRSLPFRMLITIAPDQHPGAAALLDAIAAEGLGDVLHNIGPVKPTTAGALYAQADALLMPTLIETFGMPYVEAMYHKRPVLTSDLDFARAVCGDAALYVDPLDPAAILAAMERLASSESLRRQLAAAGQDRLSGWWTWEQVYARLQQLTHGLLDRAA